MSGRRSGRTDALSLDGLLKAIDHSAQRCLIGHLKTFEAVALRATSRTAREVVDWHIPCAELRFTSPSYTAATAAAAPTSPSTPVQLTGLAVPALPSAIPSATGRAQNAADVDAQWWPDTFATRLQAALRAASSWPNCSRLSLHIHLNLISNSEAASERLTAPFHKALNDDRLVLPHISCLELHISCLAASEPRSSFSPPNDEDPDPSRPLILTPNLATALSSLCPNLEELIFTGPWASPEFAVPEPPLPFPLQQLQPQPQPQLASMQAWAKAAKAAFAALAPARLPRLRRLVVPIRVAKSRRLTQSLSGLTSLTVSCEDVLSGRRAHLHTNLDALQTLLPWVHQLRELRELELVGFTVSHAVGLAAARPPRLRRLALTKCSVQVERQALRTSDLPAAGLGGLSFLRVAFLDRGNMVFDWGPTEQSCLEFGSAFCGFLDAARILLAVAVPLRFRRVHITNLSLGADAHVADETPERSERAWTILERFAAEGLDGFPDPAGRGHGPFDDDPVFSSSAALPMGEDVPPLPQLLLAAAAAAAAPAALPVELVLPVWGNGNQAPAAAAVAAAAAGPSAVSVAAAAAAGAPAAGGSRAGGGAGSPSPCAAVSSATTLDLRQDQQVAQAYPPPVPPPPLALRLGRVCCDTHLDSLLCLVRLLREVGPVEQLDVIGPGRHQPLVALLQQLAHQVPQHRLPRSLGIYSGSGFLIPGPQSWACGGLPLAALRGCLAGWPQLRRLYLMGSCIGRSYVRNLVTLLTTSASELLRCGSADVTAAAAAAPRTPPVAPNSRGGGSSSVSGAVSSLSPSAAASSAAAAAAAAAANSSGAWCAVGCSPLYEYGKGAAAFASVVEDVLAALPRGLYLYGCRSPWDQGIGYHAMRSQVWLHVSPYRRTDLTVVSGQSVRLEYVGAGRA